jgi:DHA1 family bicyclomycin/chloramphenicol resistance-like MFS transporter
MQMIAGALASALVAYWYNGTSTAAMTGSMAMFSTLALLCYALNVYPREKRLELAAKEKQAAVTSGQN